MQNAKWLAIGLCIAFVLGAYLTWSYEIGQFNPNPVTTSLSMTTGSCSAPESCSGFRITSASLIVQTAPDIVSQLLNIQITISGDVPMSQVNVYINNTFVGSANGPFAPGQSKFISFPILTTVTVVQGTSYNILVEGTFAGESAGQPSTNQFETVQVVAS